MKRKGLLISAFGILIIIYFGIVPELWPKPEVSVSIPAEGNYWEDIPIDIEISSWHSNVKFSKISAKVYVDPSINAGKKYRVIDLHEGVSDVHYDSHTFRSHVSPISYPRSQKKRFYLSISELPFDSKDTVKGTVSVDVVYPDISRLRHTFTKHVKTSRQFEIVLYDPSTFETGEATLADDQ